MDSQQLCSFIRRHGVDCRVVMVCGNEFIRARNDYTVNGKPRTGFVDLAPELDPVREFLNY